VHAFTPAVTRWLSTHHGVITADRLTTFGVTRSQVRRLLRIGVLISYMPCIYRLAAAPCTDEQAMALACAVGTDVVVSHTSAGRIWGFRRLGGDQRLHVLTRGSAHRTLPGTVTHRCLQIDAVDIVERPDGIRVTSPPRTCFDLASLLSDTSLESVFEQVLNGETCTVPTLFATGNRLCQRGRKGSARYTRVLHSRPAWLKPVDSDLELRLEQAILAAGLPRPLRQHAIRLHTGEEIHPDFYWPSAGEVVEVDHVTWHGGRLTGTYDKQRDRKLRRIGINSTRVTDSEIRDDLRGVVDDVRAILEGTHARNVS
jgi:very-short-patch-repair endonuclease